MQWSEKDLFAVELFEPSGEEPATQRPRLPGLTVIQTTGQGINIQQGKGGAHGNTRGDPSMPGEYREFQTAKIAFFALTAQRILVERARLFLVHSSAEGRMTS